MKLQQGQTYRLANPEGPEKAYARIVKLERLAVEYKSMSRPNTKNGRHHHVSKKQFCRLIKGATLLEENADEKPVNPIDELPPERLNRPGRIR